jgi:ribonuclease T1
LGLEEVLVNRHAARRRSPPQALVLTLLAFVLIAAGCGAPASSSSAGVEPAKQAPTTATVFPAVTVSAAETAVTLTATPDRLPAPEPDAGDLVIATPRPGERMPTVRADRLPPEAHDTMRLIAAGGPFPHRQDGAVFANRERLLPIQASGYYREYTVKTPGSPDRGARRLVWGARGELYYTVDHYDSFRRVTP